MTFPEGGRRREGKQKEEIKEMGRKYGFANTPPEVERGAHLLFSVNTLHVTAMDTAVVLMLEALDAALNNVPTSITWTSGAGVENTMFYGPLHTLTHEKNRAKRARN